MRQKKIGHVLIVDSVIAESWNAAHSRFVVLHGKDLADAFHLFSHHKETIAGIILGEGARRTGGQRLVDFVTTCRVSGFERPILSPETREVGPEALRKALKEKDLSEIRQKTLAICTQQFVDRFRNLDRSRGFPPLRLAYSAAGA